MQQTHNQYLVLMFTHIFCNSRIKPLVALELNAHSDV